MPKPRAKEQPSKQVSPPRSIGNRPAVVRMKQIFDRLKQDDYPNCRTIAEQLETSTKTIARDIEVMRDQLGLPISYNAQEHGYCFTEAVHEFPTIQVTQGELLALLVAQNAIEQYRGTPYHAQLETAFAKLLAPLDGMTGYAPTDDLVSFKVTAPAKHELDVFDLLTRAIGDQFEITFEYRKLGDPTPAPRRVQPFHLAHREGRWYLIAYDTDRTAMRTFALGRITDAQATAKTFERPGDFSVDRYFAAALGVMNGKENHHVRIRFSNLASDDVRDRYFHESQAFHPQPDGTLDLTLRVSDLMEIQRIVLQWGGHAEALEPPELRTRLAQAATTLAAAHAIARRSAKFEVRRA